MSVKAHPDYSEGYFAGLNDQFRRGDSPEYEAGYKAGCEAREIFVSSGFTPQPDGSFSQTFTIRGRA